jgi:hypothetical protein
MARHSSQILELARKGAEHRYEELRAAIAALVKQFPHLRSPRAMRATASAADQASASASPVTSAPTQASGRPRRRRMSPAERKAVSERMKRYWAARRAGRKK